MATDPMMMAKEPCWKYDLPSMKYFLETCYEGHFQLKTKFFQKASTEWENKEKKTQFLQL